MIKIEEQLANGKILPLVFKLTVPAVIAQLITFLYNIVDRIFVAKIQDVGMDALAALGIVLPITLIITAFAHLIGLGGSPRASFKLGEGNSSDANKIFNTSFVDINRNCYKFGYIFFGKATSCIVRLSAYSS